jgi:hypothetical protein
MKRVGRRSSVGSIGKGTPSPNRGDAVGGDHHLSAHKSHLGDFSSTNVDRRAFGLFMAFMLAGCAHAPTPDASPTAQETSKPSPPLTPIANVTGPIPIEATSCDNCREPTVAVDAQGRLFVTDGSPETLGVSLDGGATFQQLPVPAVPSQVPSQGIADAILQTGPDGRLYYSALVWQVLDAGGVLFQSAIHVASSADAGKTWDRNVLVESPLSADRQWLAFAGDGTVYLAWLHYAGRVTTAVSSVPLITGVWVSRSDDGGLSFGAPAQATSTETEGSGLCGQPVVDSAGRLVIPYMTYGYAQDAGAAAGVPLGLRLAVSADGGRTFASRIIYQRPDGHAVGIFPSLAIHGDALALAWQDLDGHGAFMTSRDGGTTFSEPAQWWGNASLPYSPWLLWQGNRLVVAWTEQLNDTTLAAHMAVLGNATYDALLGLGHAPKGTRTSDFTHMALLPDGRAAVVWPDYDGHRILLAIAG